MLRLENKKYFNVPQIVPTLLVLICSNICHDVNNINTENINLPSLGQYLSSIMAGRLESKPNAKVI